MAGPWERFAPQPAPAENAGGPWTRFANAPPASADGSMSVDNAVRATARGAPLVGSFLDEMNAATNATLAPIVEPFLDRSENDIAQSGEDWGQRYDKSLAMQRAKDDAFDAQHPVASTGLQIVGGVAGGGAMLKAAPAAASKVLGMGGSTLPAKIAASTTAGGVGGAIQGFGEGEGGLNQRLNSAVQGGEVGAGFGAAAPVVGRVAGKIVGKVLNKTPAAPSVDDLRTAATAAYKRADDAGLYVSPKSFAKFGEDLSRKVADAGIDPDVSPKATAAMRRIQAATDQPLRLQDIDTLRKVAGGAAGATDAHERMLGKMIKDGLDDYLSGLRPSDVIAGDAKAGTQALMKARDLWSRMRKAELIEQAFEKSDLRAASTGSGANVDNVTRQNVRALLTNQKTARLFTKEEREALMTVVRGTATGNTLRYIGKLAPSGIVSAVLSGGAGAAAGGPVGAVAVPAIGFAAKKTSDAITANHLKRAQEMIRRGYPAPKAGSPLAAAYAQLIAQAGGQGDIGAPISPKAPLQITVTRPNNWDQVDPQRPPPP